MVLRKAKTGDVAEMVELIDVYAKQGLMLPRTRSSLYESLRDFTVAEYGGKIVGVAGLCILWDDLAEVRSLAVAPSWRGHGIGKQLVRQLVGEAAGLNLTRVFALTYQVKFFSDLDFQIVGKETLPQKVWKDCVHCPKFAACDEIAVITYVGGVKSGIDDTVTSTETSTFGVPLALR